MFTGIVEEIGALETVETVDDSARLRIRGPLVTSDAAHGDSISVNGVCLTVTAVEPGGYFDADVMAETLDRTALGGLRVGDPVNLERAMRADARFGGHIVQGHVDGTGTVLGRTEHEYWHVLRVSLPPELSRYVVEKGSVTVSGTSLTVSAVSDPAATEQWFEVSLIPTTLDATVLGSLVTGDRVNLEVDVLAKYVERMLAGGAGERPGATR